MSMEYFLARAVIEQRMRDWNQEHLASEVRRSEQPSPAATPVTKARRHSWLWSLVHVRHASGAGSGF